MEKMRWKIVAYHVTVCHHCGVPCMGTFLIWYVDNGLRMAFETDTLSLEEPMGELVQQASDQGRYPALPSFVREWNETVGWCAANTNGTEVSLAELIETVDAMQSSDTSHDPDRCKMLSGLREFIAAAPPGTEALWAMHD